MQYICELYYLTINILLHISEDVLPVFIMFFLCEAFLQSPKFSRFEKFEDLTNLIDILDLIIEYLGRDKSCQKWYFK